MFGKQTLDNKPEVFVDVVDNLVTWEDVETCLNFRNDMLIEVIDGTSAQKLRMDRMTTADFINSGNSFIISGYSWYNNKTNQVANKIQQEYNVKCDFHVYGGLEKKQYNSFQKHKDSTANFICQFYGETNWKVFDEFDNVELETTLKPGDVLYIPFEKYHVAEPLGKRLSISIAMWKTKPIERNYKKINY